VCGWRRILQVHQASPMGLALKAHFLAPSVSMCAGQLQYRASKMGLAQAAGVSGFTVRSSIVEHVGAMKEEC
jgi:hypothetical protein